MNTAQLTPSRFSFTKMAPFLVLALLAIGAMFFKPEPTVLTKADGTPLYEYKAADITWMLIATALVFLMTPALAFFYGGMVHRKNILSTMIKSTVSAGIVSVVWVVVGFSLCFGDSVGAIVEGDKVIRGGFIGDPRTFLFFQNVMSGKPWSLASTIPLPLFSLFQLMFAIITPGLVVGAVAERIRFRSYVLFIVLFIVCVYAPLAHMAWHPQGYLFNLGVLDFAGGTVVHISAGCAALAGALVLKRRKSHVEHREIPPSNIPYVLIGTGLLWFGWFGFNAGSALGANELAVSAFATTNTAAAAAGLAWMFFDVARGKKPSVLGFCIGAVVGLVAITPGAGYVGVPQSIFIGAVAAIISNIAVQIKMKSKIDDTLDVFPCHGIGGIVGMLLTGVFSSKVVNAAATDGLAYGGNLFGTQFKGMLIAVVFSFVVSFLIFKLVNLITPIRVSEEDEELGLDATQHNENYSQGTLLVVTKEGIQETTLQD